MKQAIIKIILIGTEDQLDLPEKDCAVLHLKDQAARLEDIVLALEHKYPNLGWSLIVANKVENKCVKKT